jgi:DNA invertase Pin-like site-specific DNA recombinase
MTPRCIVYAAKSTDDTKGSIPTQLEDCRTMAEREGLTVVAEYRDEAKSAYSGSRGDGLAQAKEHAEKIAPCSLIVQHTDRLARGDAIQAAHLVEVVLWAMKANVRIRSVQDDRTGESILDAALTGTRNYEDSKRKSEAVKAGKRRRAARGLYPGGDEPYGFTHRRVGEQRTLVPNPAQVSIVRRVYEEYVAGSSELGIAKRLTADGIRTKTGAARWHPSTIRRILTSPIYVGELQSNGERVPSNIKPIISRKLWEACQQRRESLGSTKGSGRGRPPKGPFLFTGGLLRCDCGSAMVPRSEADVYRCSGRSQYGSDFCDQPQLSRKLVDESVFAYFASRLRERR